MKSAKRSCGAPGGRAVPLILTALAFTSGCRRDMMNEPRAKTFSESDFFKDGTNARPLPLHTVARENVPESEAFSTGLTNGVYVTQLPMKVTPELLARGRERFDAFCSECHGRLGDGQGAVVQRGFPLPPSYHLERLRNAPLGHFFDVMTNGYGAMASYATQVEPRDRWAIAAYIRALQLSQNAKPADLPADARDKLEGAPK
jgi:mono/diheme cytochrome c family protein